jgi:hypothetical protein
MHGIYKFIKFHFKENIHNIFNGYYDSNTAKAKRESCNPLYIMINRNYHFDNNNSLFTRDIKFSLLNPDKIIKEIIDKSNNLKDMKNVLNDIAIDEKNLKLQNKDEKTNITNYLSNKKKFKIKFKNDNELDLSKLNENFSSLKNIKESLGYLCTRKSSSKEKYISDVNFLFDKNGSSRNSPYFLKISSGLISNLTSLIFL